MINQRSRPRASLQQSGPLGHPRIRRSENNENLESTKRSFQKHRRRSSEVTEGLNDFTPASDFNQFKQLQECMAQVTAKCSQATITTLRNVIREYGALVFQSENNVEHDNTEERRALEEANEKLNASYLRIAELEAVNNHWIQPTDANNHRNSLLEFERELSDREMGINKRQAALLVKQNQLKLQEQDNKAEAASLSSVRQGLEKERKDITVCWNKLVYEIDQNGDYSRHIKERFQSSLQLQVSHNEEQRKALARKHKRIDRLLAGIVLPV